MASYTLFEPSGALFDRFLMHASMSAGEEVERVFGMPPNDASSVQFPKECDVKEVIPAEL